MSATERETEGLIREAREFVTETADGHCADECGPANDFIARLATALAAATAENEKWCAMAETAGFKTDGMLAIGNELIRLRAATADSARLIPPPNRPHAAATNRLREYLAYARDGHQIALTKGEAGALLDLLDSSPTPAHAAPSADPARTEADNG